MEDPAHLEAYISSLIFESNEIKDSELLFDYAGISDELASVSEALKTSNIAIFDLETETDPQLEERMKRDGKRLETDLQDTDKKIAELAKSLSAEKIKAAEDKQEELAKLRDKKTQLSDLGVTIKQVLQFVDQDLSAVNQQIQTINTLAAKIGIAHTFKEIEYKDAETLKA